jgi:hypothetical protein
MVTTDRELHDRIDALVEEERTLRSSGHGLSDEQRSRLKQLEEQLDTVWDLLRRREAARDAGQDPDTVSPPTTDQVENYLQ